MTSQSELAYQQIKEMIFHMELPPFIYHHAVLQKILHFSKKNSGSKKGAAEATPFYSFLFSLCQNRF